MLHHFFSVRRALGVIDTYFEEILQDQGFLSTLESLKIFLKMIPDETLRKQVQENLERLPSSSQERWEAFIDTYNKYCKEVCYIS